MKEAGRFKLAVTGLTGIRGKRIEGRIDHGDGDIRGQAAHL
jgi:hypothetical protein